MFVRFLVRETGHTEKLRFYGQHVGVSKQILVQNLPNEIEFYLCQSDYTCSKGLSRKALDDFDIAYSIDPSIVRAFQSIRGKTCTLCSCAKIYKDGVG